MKLIELEPEFKKISPDGGLIKADGPEDAQAVMYLCPVCFLKNGGNVGTHWIITPNKNIPDGALGGHAHWDMFGTLENLTTRPSVLVVGGCEAHFYITDGEVQIL